MSGYASYDDALDPKYGDPYPVPMVTASRDTLRGYGTIVTDFKSTKVEITPWPVKGKRFVLRRLQNIFRRGGGGGGGGLN